MFETFIQFVLTTNTLSAILVCTAFVIFTLGVLCPIIDAVRGYVWQFVDDRPLSWSNWFTTLICTKLLQEGGETLRYTSERVGSYYVIVDNTSGSYISSQWGSRIPSTSRDRYSAKLFSSESLTGVLDGLSSNNTIVPRRVKLTSYILFIIAAPTLCLLGATLLNYFFMPTLYIATVVCSFWALRMVRRLQKKGVEMLNRLNKHESLSKEDAHKGE